MAEVRINRNLLRHLADDLVYLHAPHAHLCCAVSPCAVMQRISRAKGLLLRAPNEPPVERPKCGKPCGYEVCTVLNGQTMEPPLKRAVFCGLIHNHPPEVPCQP